MVSKNKNPLIMWGWDRKICHSQSLFVITRQASCCQMVILGQIFLSHPHTRDRLFYAHINHTLSALWVIYTIWRGLQKLNGRVLDLGSKGFCLETCWRHCVVSLSKTLYPLLSTGLTPEKYWHNWNVVGSDIASTQTKRYSLVHALTRQ